MYHGDNLTSRLPMELLAEVCIRWSHVDREAPWIASLVCHLWRKTVLSCPHAWSTIRLDLEDKRRDPLLDDPEWCIEEDGEDYDPRGKRRPLDLWIERSGSCALSVSLILGRVYPTVLIIHDTMRKFASALDRIEEIELGLESRMVTDMLLEMLWYSAPRLHHLNLKCGRQFRLPSTDYWEVEEEILKSLPKVLDKTPAIRALTLYDCLLPGRPNGAYNRLRELTLAGLRCSVHKLFPGLAACVHLETLKVVNCGFHDLDYAPYNPEELPPMLVTLPSLRCFRIGGSRQPEQLLWYLRAPLLETLQVNWYAPLWGLATESGTSDTASNKAIRGFMSDMVIRGGMFVQFTRAAPLIKSMTLESVYFNDNVLLSCLRQLPELRSLTLDGSLISGRLFGALSRPSVNICKYLKTVVLVSCPLLSGTMLQKFVELREGRGLERLKIVRCEKITEQDMVAVYVCDLSQSLKVHYVPWQAPVEDSADEDEDASMAEAGDHIFMEEESGNDAAGPSSSKAIKRTHVFNDHDVGPALKKLGRNTIVVHDMFSSDVAR